MILLAAENNLQATADFYKVLDIDFTERFGKRLASLFDLIGLERKIPMAAGALIKTYTSEVTLDGGTVAPGDVIPLSKVVMKAGPTQELAWDKRRKAAPAEVIQQVGYERAIVQTDEKFIREIQKKIREKLFAQLATGKGKATGANLQEALANAWAKVVTAFEDDDVRVISFMNPEDAATYLGQAPISLQNTFGMTYVEQFLSNDIVFMHPGIPKGTIYSTAAENLVLAYADVRGEINKAFDFTTDASGLIGVPHNVNKERLTAETVTISGMVLFAERIDGVVVTAIKKAE